MRKDDVLLAVVVAGAVLAGWWAYRRGVFAAAGQPVASVGGGLMAVPWYGSRSPDRVATGQGDGGVVWI